MLIEPIINISENLINGAISVSQWAITPMSFFGYSYMPIMAFSFSFLIAYLLVAIVRWIL